MISVEQRNKYQDFYNYLLLVRGQRESSATLNVQKVGVLLRSITEFSAPVIESFFVELKSQGKNNNYINRYLDVARLYCYFLQHKSVEIDSSILTIKYLKETHSERATMSDQEIEAFLNLPPKRSGPKEGCHYNRWTLFFSIMAFTGMRPQEVARLTVDTVDFGRSIFVITEEVSKTHTQRFVPIPPNIRDKLEEHVKTCDDYLFKARKNSYRFNLPIVDNVDWGYNFHDRINRLGIKRKGLCPYSLRHSLITRLLEEDVNIFKVQKIVGHRRLDTTAGYTHMTTKDIQLAIAKHPLIRKATDPHQILDAFKEIIRSFEFEKNEKFIYSLQETGNDLKIYLSFK